MLSSATVGACPGPDGAHCGAQDAAL